MSNYLYNGIELPALPANLDREMFRYLLIIKLPGATYYILLAIKEPGQYNSPYVYTGGQYCSWNCYPNNADEPFDWSGGTISESPAVTAYDIVWSNYDIYKKSDDTLYFAASEPIPVTAPEPLDPASMTMGWLTGQRIAGQRKRV